MENSIRAMKEIIDANEPRASGKAVVFSEQMDVEAYSGLYSGRTKIMRLLFIAEKCGNEVMQIEALRMAYDEIKKGGNTQLMREVVKKIGGRLGSQYDMDLAWAHSTDQRGQIRRDKLENELEAYRANMVKESIRMGYNDLGDNYYNHGLLDDAFKSYVHTWDYTTTSKHIIQTCLNVILVSIELGHFGFVSNYVAKAEKTTESLDPITISKLQCAEGLALLVAKKYKYAARKFLEIGPDLGNKYTEVISQQDVAIYGGLCALATFERLELERKVIDNVNFRNFLELIPEIRELIIDFHSCRYASCLEYLENLKSNLLLDLHLHDHVEKLYTKIRQKAIIQYTAPFISVNLNTMAVAIKTSVSNLVKELEALITENQIQARIDSHNKILYAQHANQRNATFQRVLQTGTEFERDVKAMLLRANIIKHECNNKSKHTTNSI